jgi:hypothetical protein
MLTYTSGVYQLQVTDSTGTSTNYTYESAYANTIQGVTFKGPYGGTARIIYDKSCQVIVQITYPSGEIVVYTQNASGNPPPSNGSQPPPSNGSQPPPSNGSQPPQSYPSYSTPANYYSNDYKSSYYNDDVYGASVTGPNGNTYGYASGPNGNTVTYSNNNNYDYSNSLPPGIPKTMIPAGQEDLYILKSEVIPPVCPVCPTLQASNSKEKCPPCPACARCPSDSNFECKKVPNYNNPSGSGSYLPMPVLNSFSTFGL